MKLVHGVDGCRIVEVTKLTVRSGKAIGNLRKSPSPNPYRLFEAAVKGGLVCLTDDNASKTIRGEQAMARLRWDDAVLVVYYVFLQTKSQDDETADYQCPRCGKTTTKTEHYAEIKLNIPQDVAPGYEFSLANATSAGEFSARSMSFRWAMLADYVNTWTPGIGEIDQSQKVLRSCLTSIDGIGGEALDTIRNTYFVPLLDTLDMSEYGRLWEGFNALGLPMKTEIQGECGHTWKAPRNFANFFGSLLGS